MQIGQTFNESRTFLDSNHGSPTMVLAENGIYNETPTYHLNAAITADSKYVIFATMREGRSALCKGNLSNGDCTLLFMGEEIDGYDLENPKACAILNPRLTGNHLSLSQVGSFAVFIYKNSLQMVHIDTFEHRILIEGLSDGYAFSTPMPTPDGLRIVVPVNQRHPHEQKGLPVPQGWEFWEAFVTARELPSFLIEVDLLTGKQDVVFKEESARNNHVQPSPVDSDLWLIDRDFPPHYSWAGDEGKTGRAWLLERKSGKLRELQTRNENRFQIHTNWNLNGDRIYYHGRSQENGMYVGVCDSLGQCLWEYELPDFHYGHVSVDLRHEAILTDGLVSPDCICSLTYGLGSDKPLIEILGRHDTKWNKMPGQLSHPHCQMSPDGNKVVYNKGSELNSQICVLNIN